MDLIRDCLGFRISAAYRRVDRLFNRALRRLGISYAHGQVLMCLLQDGPMRAADVADRTGFERSTVSRLVKELSRRKLVRRLPHPADGRARLLEPAKRGEALRVALSSSGSVTETTFAPSLPWCHSPIDTPRPPQPISPRLIVSFGPILRGRL